MTAVARVLAGLAVALLVAAIGTGSTLAGDSAALRDRSTTDLADDFQGPQVHFMYVLPADGTDNQLDTNGVVEQSIVRVENWMLGQTGNQGLTSTRITASRTSRSSGCRIPTLRRRASNRGRSGRSAPISSPRVLTVPARCTRSSTTGTAAGPAVVRSRRPCRCWGRCTCKAGRPTTRRRATRGVPGPRSPVTSTWGSCTRYCMRSASLRRALPTRARTATGTTSTTARPTSSTHPTRSRTAPWDVLHAVLDYHHDDYYRANIPGCPDLSNSPYLTPMISVAVTTNGDRHRRQ